MPRTRVRRAGLVLGGFIGGLVLVALIGVVYFRVVTDPDLAESVLKAIDLPSEAMELESIEGDSIARVALREVEFRDEAGAPVATAPLVRLAVDLRSMEGDGPIELSEVVLSQPTVNFVQYANGENNLSRVVSVTAGGQEVAGGESTSRGVVIRNFRIAEGDIRWSSPYAPDSAASTAGLRLTRIGGSLMRVRTIQDLELWAPVARFGGEEGWRVEVASASAQLTDPAVRVVSLAGFAEEAPNESLRFALDDFRTQSSSITGEGLIGLGGETARFDVELRAAPLAFSDLRWFSPLVPDAGQAEGTFTLASRDDERIEVSARDLVVTAFDSRIAGRVSALVGGDAPASFWDTSLSLEPLRIETLEQLGLIDDAPYTGEIRGTVGSEGATVGEATPLRLDLAASFVPVGEEEVPTSTLFLRGPLSVGGAGGAVRFEGVEIAAQPLYLAALIPLAPEQRERLRGVVRGTALLRGTPDDLRVEGGDIAYEVGATRSRLTELALQLRMGDVPRFTLDARAEPLALGTLSELFPAFPFRTATFSGPIHIEGTTESFRIDTELSGPAGLIALNGTIAPGTTLGFDLTGRVASFNTQAVLESSGALESPVTGRFAVAGNVDDLRFDVDLTQPVNGVPADSGRFALQGTFRRVGGEPLLDVAGDVANFNLGALIGRPALFPSRMTGAVSVAGGGREPYRFDLDLRGASGALDVAGTYRTGAIPTYEVAGVVEGLNLRHLPGGEALPQSSLNATIDLRGQGTTLETLAGEYRINATPSTIAGRPLEALEADIGVQGGVATVRRLQVALAETRLSAEGTWGLTQPVASPLNFRLDSPNLARLAPFLPTVQGVEPQISGSVELSGSVAGSVRVPVVDVVFQGDNLRYEGWRARELEFGLAATLGRSIQEITGELSLTGRDLDLAGRTALSSLTLGLEGGGAQIAVRAAAEREDETGVALTGLLEMRGSTPAGVLLDSLTVRARDQAAWALTAPTTIRWGGTEGIFVSNLNLQRTDGTPGVIAVNGSIPPNGVADLRVSVESLDLALFRDLVPTMPQLQGMVHLDAVLAGPVGDPELTLDGSVADFVFRDVSADSISLRGRYQARVFTTTASVWMQGADVAVAEAAIPMQLTFSESLPTFQLLRTEPLTASIVADSLPVSLLASSVPTIEDPSGIITTQLTASGTVDRPVLRGWAHLEEGAATFTDLGVRYDEMHGRLTFEDDLVRIDSLVIRSDGTAIANGTARLVDLTSPEIFLSAQMDGFHAIDNDEIADLTMSGQVTLSGRMPRPVLTGRVSVDGGTIYFPDFGAPVPLELTEIEIEEVTPDTLLAMAVGPGFVQNVQISDLNVVLAQGVWMEAPTARVEIRGELVVFRSGRDMRLYGNLEAARGTYALTIGPIVREFDVTGGTVRFLGTADLNPELDIVAEHEVRSVAGGGAPARIAIVVRVTGTAEYPRVSLTSDTRPPLPESELLNYLVFGQPSFRLNQQGFAQQLVVQEILGGLLVQELAQLGLPCEYLRLRGRPTQIGIAAPLAGFGSTSVECGVQVLPDVFLTLETGIASAVNPSNPLNALLGVSLDWQVKDYLAARIAREPVRTGIGALFQSGDVPYQWSGDLNGNWEFGHPDTVAAAVQPQVPEGRLPGEAAPLPPIPPQGPDSVPLEPPPPAQGAVPARRDEDAGAP